MLGNQSKDSIWLCETPDIAKFCLCKSHPLLHTSSREPSKLFRVNSSLVFNTEGILLLSVNRRSENILYSSDPVAVEFLLQLSFDSVPVNSFFSEPDALSSKRYWSLCNSWEEDLCFWFLIMSHLNCQEFYGCHFIYCSWKPLVAGLLTPFHIRRNRSTSKKKRNVSKK